MENCKANKSLLPYEIIEAGILGDIDALNTILQHYAGYIASLSTQRGFDRQGCPWSWIDDDLRKRLETRLIVATLRFNPY